MRPVLITVGAGYPHALARHNAQNVGHTAGRSHEA